MHPPGAYDSFTGGMPISDLYSWIKAWVVIAAGYAAVGGLLWRSFVPRWPVLIFAGVLGFFVILSTAISQHSDIALQGAPWLSEGCVVLLAYLVLMVAASDLKYWPFISRAVCISALLVTAAGMAEVCDHSWLTEAPWWAIGLDEGEHIQRTQGLIAATLGNPNHLGSYAALVIPVIAMTGYDAKPRWIVISAATVIGLAIVLKASGSRLGGIGVIAGLIAGLWVRGRHA
jgi:hypothetical protein